MNDIEYLKKYLDKDKLEQGIKRLQNGEPVQYIVGNVDFYGYILDVNENVLIPRFETEELVFDTIKYINKYFNKKIDILDIGTGSGCIAITLSKKVNANIDAIDISEKSLEIARKNSKKNKCRVNFFKSDMFSSVNKKYDVIISNPPYIATNEKIMEIVKNNEPDIALYGGVDGLDFYRTILKESKKYLKEKSIISLEIGSNQAEKIKQLALNYFKSSKIILKNDYNNLNRYVYILNGIDD